MEPSDSEQGDRSADPEPADRSRDAFTIVDFRTGAAGEGEGTAAGGPPVDRGDGRDDGDMPQIMTALASAAEESSDRRVADDAAAGERPGRDHLPGATEAMTPPAPPAPPRPRRLDDWSGEPTGDGATTDDAATTDDLTDDGATTDNRATTDDLTDDLTDDRATTDNWATTDDGPESMIAGPPSSGHGEPTTPTGADTGPTTGGDPTVAIDALPATAHQSPIEVGPGTSPAAPTAASTRPATAGRSKPTRPAGPSRGRRRLFMVAAPAVGLYLLLGAAWAVDAAAHRERAARGVHLADIDVGGADREELANAVNTLTDRLAGESIEVRVGSATLTADPVSLGARLDEEAMIEEALAAGRDGSLPLRPFAWAADLFGSYTVEPVYTADPDAARLAAENLIDPVLEEAVEPSLDIEGDDVVLVPGAPGVQVEPEELVAVLPGAIATGPPYRIELSPLDDQPELQDAEVAAVADEINLQTSQPIAVRVLDDLVEISPNTQRSWMLLDTEGDRPGWTIDETLALSDLRPLFPTLGSEDQQARFEIVDGQPIIIPASETVICCAENSGAILAETIASPLPAETPDGEEGSDEVGAELRTAELEPVITGFDEGVAELESLGIVEQVSTFTTNHDCCQNRVENIQRFADLMQGVVIRPGEDLSLNGYVGQRTTEKGFVADGAISQGNFEQQVGGGISQYATTFFNAAFFAGVEFLEYQSHSIYISRYPRGREATISWRKPDLKIRNNTPYGILVWNEYTPTSITVSFYSTRHLEVEALPLLRSSDRQCRIDITPRRITHPDGTVTEDSVRAIYRPGEGLDCNGDSTKPEEEPEAEPEPQPPAPAPEPEPQPTPTTTPAPDPGDGGGEVLPPGE